MEVVGGLYRDAARLVDLSIVKLHGREVAEEDGALLDGLARESVERVGESGSRLIEALRVQLRVARRNVVAPWRDGGQSQFSHDGPPDPVAPDEPGTAATRAFALDHLDEPLPLERMAAHAAMSVRTFTRRFRAETGQSPHGWLAAQRVTRARRLLETTDLPVDRVAVDAGFGTATSLRQHLRAAIGVSPGAYRRMYRGPVR